MDDFAERRIDKFGGFGEFFVIGVRVGDAGFVGGVENFRDGFFDNAGAGAVGTIRVHTGEAENGDTPDTHESKHYDYNDSFPI